MENRSGETNNPQNSAENAFDYAAADITNELPRGDMLQDPAGEPFQSTFEEEKPKKLNFFNKIGRMNPQKRTVLLVRIFIVIAFSVLFAVYCVKTVQISKSTVLRFRQCRLPLLSQYSLRLSRRLSKFSAGTTLSLRRPASKRQTEKPS